MAATNPPMTRADLATRLTRPGAKPPHASTIGRWIGGETRPDTDTLVEIANIFGEDPGELLTLAGYGTPTEVSAALANLRPLHPLLAEINDMLDPDIGLPADRRQAIEGMLELIVTSGRKDMRKRRSA